VARVSYTETGLPPVVNFAAMQSCEIDNLTHPLTSPILVKYCTSFLCRLRGLTFKSSLPPQHGLLLVQSNDSRLNATIHMLGVWFNIAVVWINKKETVVDKNIARRWHLVYVPRQPTCYILEMSASRINDFQIGDRVKIGVLEDSNL
jgi:uncharacterized membrane protein (UPF0127 family)